MVGDSLIETINGAAIYPTRPGESKASQLSLIESGTQRLIHQLRELKEEFFQPAGNRPANAIKQEIVRTEREIVIEALREREQLSRERLTHLSTSLVNTLSTQTKRVEIETLRRDIQTTQQAIADLKAGKALPLFLYRLHFASVFEEKDGFDIVIANPPYVRHERIPQETLHTLRVTYLTVQNGMADLYVYFYARALELLHEDGTLAFISSNKFFRAGYGKGLRALLTSQTKAQIILDFGDAPVFDAAAYPCIVLTAKGSPAPDHTYSGLTADNHIDLEKMQTIFESRAVPLSQIQGVEPPANSSTTSTLVQKLMQVGIPLGMFINSRMYRGVTTGLNEAFVINQVTYDRLISEDQRSVEVLKPFLRGRDLARYVLRPTDLWLIKIDHGWTYTTMEAAGKVSEAQAWSFFSKDYPAVAAYLEPFAEKAKKRDDKGQFWWELRSCNYYFAFEESKILSVRFGLQNGFVYDDQKFYCNDAVYFFSPAPKWLTAILNSSVCNICLISICPTVQNGYSQFFVNKIRQLPIVEPSPEDQVRLMILVERLQALGGQGPEATALEQEVDAIIYQMYNLSDEEIAEIERWHAVRWAQLGVGKRGQLVEEEEA